MRSGHDGAGAGMRRGRNGDGVVAINEVILGVNIALDLQPLALCPVFDQNENGIIAINEIILGVGFGLNGCP
jgi:hypothetical protein